MSSHYSLRRRAMAMAGLVISGSVVLTGCSDRLGVNGPVPVNPLFQSYVALGNSITAGYQGGGISDSTQQQSYALLLAKQMNTRYAYASLANPGCPPPIVNFQTQARSAGQSSTFCALRNSASITGALNNVAVPGATSLDPTSVSTAASNALTSFILGGKTQVQRAADAAPTFVSAWIGNNDVLIAGLSGLLTTTSSGGTVLSPGVTPQATFQTNYDAMVAGLKAIPSLKGAVLIGVVQVSAAPLLFPATALLNSAFKTGFDQFAGTTTVIHPSCTPTVAAQTLISFQLASAIRSGQHPAVIACAKNAVPSTLVGDIFVLDATEQATLATAITNYNTYIQSVATANGWAYYDPNTTLATLKSDPTCITTFPALADPLNTFGTCISLDGVHPRLPAHKAVANALIDVINAKYGTSIAKVP